MKRAALVALAAVLLAAAAALLWLASSLDGRVEDALEQIGSELLGAPLRVGSVSIDLGKGSATLRAVSLGNPESAGVDFSRGPAFALEQVDVTIDLGSLAARPLVLERVRVVRPEVNAEIRGASLNLDVLRRHVADQTASEVATPDTLDTEGEPLRLRIRRFELEQGALRLDTGDPERATQELPLASFSLRDVGGPGGAEPASVGKTVLEAILRHAASAVARRRARDEAGAWIDEKLQDRPGAADAARQVLEGILGDPDD